MRGPGLTVHVRNGRRGELATSGLHKLSALAGVPRLEHGALHDAHPTAPARVVVDGALLAAVPADEHEGEALPVRGNEVARVLLLGLKVPELVHAAVIHGQAPAKSNKAISTQSRCGVPGSGRRWGRCRGHGKGCSWGGLVNRLACARSPASPGRPPPAVALRGMTCLGTD